MGLLKDIEGRLLSSPLGGGAEGGNIEVRAASRGFADLLELEDLLEIGAPPKLKDAATGTALGLSVGFPNEAVNGPGAEAEAASGGAPNPIDLGSEDKEAFFWSSNLALIFAIASASKSCFSHLEKVLNPPLRVV